MTTQTTPTKQQPDDEVLKENAAALWRVFVDGDPSLAESTCACCGAKRALRRAILEKSKQRAEEAR